MSKYSAPIFLACLGAFTLHGCKDRAEDELRQAIEESTEEYNKVIKGKGDYLTKKDCSAIHSAFEEKMEAWKKKYPDKAKSMTNADKSFKPSGKLQAAAEKAEKAKDQCQAIAEHNEDYWEWYKRDISPGPIGSA